MKIAVFGDIHGNLIALDAVLRDIETVGRVDAYWLLGDYCAIGSNPVGVLERITRLPNAIFIRGNTERYTVSGFTPSTHLEEVVGHARLVEQYAEIAASFAWTRGAITQAGWYDWLKGLPIEQRPTLPNGVSVLLVHANPGYDDGPGITPIDSDEWVQEHFCQCDETLIFVGHTHWPQERRVAGKHIINPGSVGNPVADRRACYALLDVDSDYKLSFREVDYDVEAVINHIYGIHHPTEDYLLGFYRGSFVPEWYKQYLQARAE